MKQDDRNNGASAAAHARVIAIDFTKPKRESYQHLGGGVYKDPRNGNLYENPKIDGRYTWRKLQANTHKFALKELRKKRSDQAMAKLGLAIDPYKRSDDQTISQICNFYIAGKLGAGSGRHASGKRETAQERTRAETIARWSGAKKPAKELTPEDWLAYYQWRKKTIRGAGKHPERGDRQIDKERITLSNIFRYAVDHQSKTGVTKNPVNSEEQPFPRFRKSASVKHCRDAMPRTGDELHTTARFFLESGPRSEVLGWFELFTAGIGHRAEAMTRLRIDAGEKEPGAVADGKLYLYRSTTSKGTYGHRDLDPDFEEMMAAHRAWHWRRHPGSPWYFPSPEDPTKPISPAALTHAFDRVCKALGLPKRTTHGLRAFRVNVLRGEGLTDPEVAIRVGQKTHGKLIVEVYGEGLDYKLTWRPTKGPPAWVKDDLSIPPPEIARYIQSDLPLPRLLVQGELPFRRP
jgi:hypothetical protein